MFMRVKNKNKKKAVVVYLLLNQVAGWREECIMGEWDTLCEHEHWG